MQLTLIREKKKVRLSVQNFGSTIPEADLPHVFDRYYRSDKSRKSESGSFGLGLAITKEMAEKLGGEISVAGTAEAGTVFQVIFSLEKREPVISHKQKAPELLQRSGRGTLLYPKRADIQRKSPRTGNPGVVCPMRFERTTFRVGV